MITPGRAADSAKKTPSPPLPTVAAVPVWVVMFGVIPAPELLADEPWMPASKAP